MGRGGAGGGLSGGGRRPLGSGLSEAQGALQGGPRETLGPEHLENSASGSELEAESAQFSFPETKEMYFCSSIWLGCVSFLLIKLRTPSFLAPWSVLCKILLFYMRKGVAVGVLSQKTLLK